MKTFVQHLITIIIVLVLVTLLMVVETIVRLKTNISVCAIIGGAYLLQQYSKIKEWLFK